jgi:hypothetical protein
MQYTHPSPTIPMIFFNPPSMFVYSPCVPSQCSDLRPYHVDNSYYQPHPQQQNQQQPTKRDRIPEQQSCSPAAPSLPNPFAKPQRWPTPSSPRAPISPTGVPSTPSPSPAPAPAQRDVGIISRNSTRLVYHKVVDRVVGWMATPRLSPPLST